MASDISVIKAAGDLTSTIRTYICSASTAIAPVAAMPTTAAHVALWNGEGASGKKYIIHAIGTIITTSAGAAINLGLAAHLSTVAVGAAPSGTAETILPLTSGGNYGGFGKFQRAVTVVNDGIWHNVTPSLVCANTANILMAVHQEVQGRYIVYPGMVFSLASLCNAAGTAVCKPYIIWSEAPIDQSKIFT